MDDITLLYNNAGPNTWAYSRLLQIKDYTAVYKKNAAEQLYIVIPSAVQYGCLLDQAAVGWGFTRVLRSNTVIMIPPVLHIHPHSSIIVAV